MNRHALVDRLFLAMARAASWRSGQYFRDGFESATFAEHLAESELTLPSLGAARPGLELVARTRAGELDCGLLILRRPDDPTAPLLVWNHGGGEIPFERTLARALASGEELGAHVVAVRAPHHRSLADLYAGVATLDRYLAMIAVATRLTECVLRAPELAGARRRVVAGFSLGGFVANRHHLAFDSAQAYVPFMAGTAQAEIFLTSYPAARRAREHPEALRRALDFGAEWRARSHPNVFPVLGRFDRLNRLEVQQPSYGELASEVWESGHITGAGASSAIRAVLARQLFPLAAPTPARAVASLP
jgi:hypothetical protein